MVAGVGLKHLTGEVKKMLSRIMAIDQNNYPEMLGHTCIINAPSIFKFVWQAIRSFIDPKTQEKIEVCDPCLRSHHLLLFAHLGSRTPLSGSLKRQQSIRALRVPLTDILQSKDKPSGDWKAT
jgi:hypothetical protein